MTAQLPKPGRGLVVRQRLGGGYWKEAYRAVDQLLMRDVAVLVYKDEKNTSQMSDDISIWMKLRKSKFADYLAMFHRVEVGDDNRIYFVEELLAKPLDKVAPLRNGERFLRIARDLSKGLAGLHEIGLVHRDLKLDNCGVDINDRAKIFDLGSATSEEGSHTGTIATRAPEIVVKKANHDRVSDIWALGATLLALRVGTYPFVTFDEIEKRREILEAFRRNEISLSTMEQRRATYDDRIRDRYFQSSAEKTLADRARSAFSGEPGEFLAQMLSFSREARPSIEQCVTTWEQLCVKLNSPGSSSTKAVDAVEIEYMEGLLRAYLNGGVAISDRRWDAVQKMFEEFASKPELRELMQDARKRRLSNGMQNSLVASET